MIGFVDILQVFGAGVITGVIGLILFVVFISYVQRPPKK